MVVADLGLTGLLHFDGLIDSADGLLPPLTQARRLEVMADPHAGAFGVAAAAAVLLVRWASLATLRPGRPPGGRSVVPLSHRDGGGGPDRSPTSAARQASPTRSAGGLPRPAGAEGRGEGCARGYRSLPAWR